MNLHMQRRMEVLQREIAAAKKPKIDEAANAAFNQIAQRPTGKTIGDLKSNDALKPRAPRNEIDHMDCDPTNNHSDNLRQVVQFEKPASEQTLRQMYEAAQTEVADRIVALSIQLKQAMKDAEALKKSEACIDEAADVDESAVPIQSKTDTLPDDARLITGNGIPEIAPQGYISFVDPHDGIARVLRVEDAFRYKGCGICN